MTNLLVMLCALGVGSKGADGGGADESKARVEELRAVPADPAASQEGEVRSTTGGATELAATAAPAREAQPAFGLKVIMDNSVGTGNFVRNAELRERADYVAQNWDIRPSYTFPVYDHQLKAMARILFEYEITQPDTNPSRRFKPADASLYLMDANIYKEPLTEILVNGGVRWFLPTSYESIQVKRQWAGARLFAGLSRSVGPVDLSYSFQFSKYFNSSHVAHKSASVARADDPGRPPSGLDDPGYVPSGFANPSFDFINDVAVAYNFNEELSVSYELLIWNTFKYKVVGEPDGYSSPNADYERGRTDMLWPTLEVSYKLDRVAAPLELPFSVTASAGVTALHPAQTTDNQGLMWPVFYQAFAQNRAANNYGSIYLDLIGTY